jgi:hypothetical protein
MTGLFGAVTEGSELWLRAGVYFSRGDEYRPREYFLMIGLQIKRVNME